MRFMLNFKYLTNKQQKCYLTGKSTDRGKFLINYACKLAKISTNCVIEKNEVFNFDNPYFQN